MRRVQTITTALLLALPMAVALAAPLGYSVNSDQPLGDTLYQIDMQDGSANNIGSGVSSLGTLRTDIEGLALAPDLSLWGLDEERLTLFQINTTSGVVEPGSEVSITGLDAVQFNDFGLTFTCDGSLYASSVISQSLYQIDDTGQATRVGAAGSLGVNISALASIGSEPQRLIGLGNGLLGDEGPADNRSLYEINPLDGTATLIGDIGAGPADYSQAGLSFDDAGNLWAITDRSQTAQFSQILSINPNTGVAAVQATTSILGFESLAVAPPGGCQSAPVDPNLDAYRIPTLSGWGQWLAFTALLLAGFAHFRRRQI